MQADKGVRVEPVATRPGPAINERKLDIGLLPHQCVGEGEATRP